MLGAIYLRDLAESVRRHGVTVKNIEVTIPHFYPAEARQILEESVNQASKGYRELNQLYLIEDDASIAVLVRIGIKLIRTKIIDHYKISW